MRLRNPGATQAAIDAAGEMLRLLQNARNEMSVTGDKRDGFLAWCDSYARPQIRNLFAPTEELLAELNGPENRTVIVQVLAQGEAEVRNEAADRVVRALRTAGLSITIPGKPGGDVTSWLAVGGTAEISAR